MAAQSRELPVPYSLPAMTTRGSSFFFVLHRGVVDRHDFARRQVFRHAAFRARRHVVADADVGERAAHHHFVVAAAGAVGVEIVAAPRRDSIKYLPAGLLTAMVPGGGDVVGRDRIAEQRQDARLSDRLDGPCFRREALEERRFLNVSGFLVPFVQLRLPARESRSSVRCASKTLAYFARNISGAQRRVIAVFDFFGRRPDVFQVNGLVVAVVADRIFLQVDVHRAGQRISDDERRRSQVVRFDVGVNRGLRSCGCRTARRRRSGRCLRSPGSTSSGSGPLLPIQVVQP